MARTSRERRDEAARRYQAGERAGDVIADMGLDVHPSTVVRWAGGASRPGPRGRADLDDGEIVRLRDAEALSWDEIGRRTGASRSAVRGHYDLAKAVTAAGAAR